MTVELEHPAWGVIRQVGVPFEFSTTPATIRTPPPLLGQDTDAILDVSAPGTEGSGGSVGIVAPATGR